MYTQVQQKATIANIVGSMLLNRYITEMQFLTRGHLAAKTDFIYANGQRASFFSSMLLLSGIPLTVVTGTRWNK